MRLVTNQRKNARMPTNPAGEPAAPTAPTTIVDGNTINRKTYRRTSGTAWTGATSCALGRMELALTRAVIAFPNGCRVMQCTNAGGGRDEGVDTRVERIRRRGCEAQQVAHRSLRRCVTPVGATRRLRRVIPAIGTPGDAHKVGGGPRHGDTHRLAVDDGNLVGSEEPVDEQVLGDDIGILAESRSSLERQRVGAGAPQRSQHRRQVSPSSVVALHKRSRVSRVVLDR